MKREVTSFLQCSFTRKIWDDIMGLDLVSDAKTNWKELEKWGATQRKLEPPSASWLGDYCLPIVEAKECYSTCKENLY